VFASPGLMYQTGHCDSIDLSRIDQASDLAAKRQNDVRKM